MRLLRWADRLAQYSYNIEYHPGRQNVVADYLSRSDESIKASMATGNADSDSDTIPTISTIFGNPALHAITFAELAIDTEADNVLKRLLLCIQTGWSDKRPDDASFLPYFYVPSGLSFCAGVIYRGEQAVIPVTMRSRVLQLAHEGHPGVGRMRQRLREAVWWPAIGRDAEQHVKNCEPCLLAGKSARPAVPPMRPIALPPHSWHTVAVDIKGPLHNAPESHKFLFIAYDLYSKWPIVQPTTSIGSQAVLRFL